MGQEEVQWIVHSASSESDEHAALNVFRSDLDKPWLTEKPTDAAWLVLEPRPATAFNRVEIVNAGSAIVEIHGVRDDQEGDEEYELLLSAQQVMSVKDLVSKSHRNQAFTYDIEGNRKLSSGAAQQRWRKIRVSCRQPLGTSEHRACIGLAYINFTACQCESKSTNNFTQTLKVKPATKRKLPSWLSTSEPKAVEEEEVPEKKKPRANHEQDVELEHGESSQGKAADKEGRSSGLKRRSPGAKESGGEETKKAKLDSGISPIKPSETRQSEDNELNVDRGKQKIDKQGGSSSQRKGKASREETQVHKNGSERELAQLLEGVVFTISGIQNPERGQLRCQGLEMGAQYRPDWSKDCTLLVCAYVDTPKFKQVQADGGSIISKDWISECYKKQKLVDFERFVLNEGKPWRLPDNPDKVVKRKKVNCGSEEEIRKWAQEDLTSIIDWLQQQDAMPEPEELESTAAQGILVCLEDAVKSLTENRGLSSIVENWGFLPRAVRELAAIEEGEGGHNTTTSKSTLHEAERLKGIYDQSLKEFLSSSSSKPTNAINQMKTHGNDEADDDATEIMSDVDSQETVDYDSDDTTVMDAQTIEQCTQKLMGRFAK